jgi:hypothetical protein
MTRTLEVEIDESGTIRPLDPNAKLPAGSATLVYDQPDHSCYLLSEAALSDWLSPEEDEAWAYLQTAPQNKQSQSKA